MAADHLNLTFNLHEAPPTTEPVATREYEDLVTYGDASLFLWEAVQRVAKGIKPGERREIGIGLVIEALAESVP